MTDKNKFVHAVAGMYQGFTDDKKFEEYRQVIYEYDIPLKVDNKLIFDFLNCVDSARDAWKKADTARFHLQREAFIEFAMLIIEKVTE